MMPSSQQLKFYANDFNFDIVDFYREVWCLIFQGQQIQPITVDFKFRNITKDFQE